MHLYENNVNLFKNTYNQICVASIVHFYFEQCYRAQAHCTTQISTHVEWRYHGGSTSNCQRKQSKCNNCISYLKAKQKIVRWKISLSHHKMGVIQMQYQNDLQVIQNSLKGCLLKKTLPTPQQRGFLGSQKTKHLIVNFILRLIKINAL